MNDDILTVIIFAFVVWCVIPAICVAMVADSRKREGPPLGSSTGFCTGRSRSRMS